MSFDDIVADLKIKQAHIEGLHAKLEQKKSEFEVKVKELAKPMQDELDILQRELEEKIAYYKAETKRHFGIADGERMNVVETIAAFKKAISL